GSSVTATKPANPSAIADSRGAPATVDPRGEQLDGVLDELLAVGAIDPAAQQRLMADLKQTDPALRPQLARYFRATLEYQRKMHTADNAEGAPATQAIATAPHAGSSGTSSGASPDGISVAMAGAGNSPAPQGAPVQTGLPPISPTNNANV